ncbi:MAG: paraquat-inducible membrane protein A [Magnetococcales bacterium]|nr:paraquat-inducible protein A [Magnetococcales bacterium]NGZ28108.1 paraquat-inducible membrane protein A [Magnetococcales bacterium]
MAEHAATAMQAGWMLCHRCGMLHRPTVEEVKPHCPRCRAALYWRKPDSLARAWAYLVTAVILYIPANTLPVMKVVRFGYEKSDTILSGIRVLLDGGMWMLAIIVLVASIVIPLAKMVIMAILLVTVQTGSRWRPQGRTSLYRLIDGTGYWSMVDIYVLATLAALVQMEVISAIEVEAGASYFGAIVVLTMLSSKSFDPRLIWDAMEPNNGPSANP